MSLVQYCEHGEIICKIARLRAQLREEAEEHVDQLAKAEAVVRAAEQLRPLLRWCECGKCEYCELRQTIAAYRERAFVRLRLGCNLLSIR